MQENSSYPNLSKNTNYACFCSGYQRISTVEDQTLVVLLNLSYRINYNISSGVSNSDGSCVLGRIHSDVSSNIPKKVYHIVTDNFVNLLHISYT